ncbi:MAG: hypothetical protein WC091_19835 [Sulfuricellaceae bacterium]
MEYITLQNGLLLTLAMLGGFGWRWVDRIQSQQDDLRKSLGTLREKLLEDYAKKSDVNGGDERILERIKELDANVQRIYDKLDGKKDKDRV